MANWLERARREIQKTPYRPTAKTAKTLVSSVMAVPQPGDFGISRASIVSNGSIHAGPDAGAEEVSPALAAAYRQYWAAPESASMETFTAILAEIGTLEARIDPCKVIEVLEAEAVGFHLEAGICPFCGKVGPLHHHGEPEGQDRLL